MGLSEEDSVQRNEKLSKMTKGEAANLITRLKHGARVSYL